MIIDTNAYLGAFAFRQLRHNTAGQLLRLMDAKGIDKALVSNPMAITYKNTQPANEELAAAETATGAAWRAAAAEPSINRSALQTSNANPTIRATRNVVTRVGWAAKAAEYTSTQAAAPVMQARVSSRGVQPSRSRAAVRLRISTGSRARVPPPLTPIRTWPSNSALK